MQLAAFLRDVLIYLALQFADKFRLNSRANKLLELQYWTTKTILQQGTKSAKLLVLMGVDVFSPCAVTLQGDYI